MMQTQVALSRPRDADSYRAILESNAEEFERLARMISDMLFLAKAENAWPSCTASPWTWREVQDLFDFYEALADEQAIRLDVQGAGVVLGDDRFAAPGAEQPALQRAAPYPPGQVTVTIVRQAGQIVLTVENTGKMIPAQHLARLFERFLQG